MGIFSKSDDEQVESPSAKARRREAKQQANFLASAVGQARTAFDGGGDLFQIAFSAEDHRGPHLTASSKIAAYAEPNTATKTLNAIRREGWALVSSSFVYEMRGSSQTGAGGGGSLDVSGTTVGYYVFRRDEQLRGEGGRDPGSTADPR